MAQVVIDVLEAEEDSVVGVTAGRANRMPGLEKVAVVACLLEAVEFSGKIQVLKADFDQHVFAAVQMEIVGCW